MLTQDIARSAQPHRDFLGVGIRDSSPAVVPVHSKDRHQHGDHQRNGYPPGRQTQQKKQRADGLGVSCQVSQQLRCRQSEPPVGVPEPFDRAVDALYLLGARHPEHGDQVKPQRQRRQAIEVLQAGKYGVVYVVIPPGNCIHY